MDLIEFFNERAAIKQHDGKLSKYEAEKQAWFELKREHGLTVCPPQIANFLKQNAL